MIITCPLCGESCESDIEIQIGQHIQCPFCEQTFSYNPEVATEEGLNYGSTKSRIFCASCGTEMTLDSKFCPRCGQAVSSESSAVNEQGRSLSNAQAQQEAESGASSNGLVKRMSGVTAALPVLFWFTVKPSTHAENRMIYGGIIAIILFALLIAWIVDNEKVKMKKGGRRGTSGRDAVV